MKWTVVNLTDSKRRPIPLSDSLLTNVVLREGWLTHYDLLDLHKPELSVDMKKVLADFQLQLLFIFLPVA